MEAKVKNIFSPHYHINTIALYNIHKEGNG